MPHDDDAPALIVRLVADDRFRAAVIDDPLRALAEAGPVSVTPTQVRALEDMSRDERAAAITALVRDVHLRGAQARFGPIRPDGRIGGADPVG